MNNVNLGTARVFVAAIRHVAGNEFKFDTLGALAAVFDPAFTPIRSAINPKVVGATANAWKNIPSRQVPVLHVDITYKPAIDHGNLLSERSKTDPNAIEAGAATTLTLAFDYHNERHWRQNVRKELLEPRAQEYIRQYLSGKLRLGGDMASIMANTGLEILRSAQPTLLDPYNKWILTQLIAGIGRNRAYPTASAPTTAAPHVGVAGFDANGNPRKEPWSVIMNTKTANKINGKPILVGGFRWLRWHREMSIMVANSDGVDFAKVYNTLPWVFYYDEHIDALLGENKALLLDPAAVAVDTVSHHDRTYSYMEPEDFITPDTVMTNAVLNISQYNQLEPGLSNIPSSLPFIMDLRIEKTTDANDLPVKTFKPSIASGMYLRPLGFFTADTSQILHGVTGIFCFEMDPPAPAA